MAYKDSDYTAVIAMIQLHNNCTETHLGGGDTSAFVLSTAAIAQSLSSTLVASTALQRPHKNSDHTAVIVIVHWRLYAKTHRAGEVVSSVISSSYFWTPVLTRSTEHGPRVTCALIGMSCKPAIPSLRVQRVTCTHMHTHTHSHTHTCTHTVLIHTPIAAQAAAVHGMLHWVLGGRSPPYEEYWNWQRWVIRQLATRTSVALFILHTCGQGTK